MEFSLNKTIQILERTPQILQISLKGIDPDWYLKNEGGNSWSPYDIVKHLIQGENNGWFHLVEIILSPSVEKKFPIPATLQENKENPKKSIDDLLDEFSLLREKNLKKLNDKDLNKPELLKKGLHPEHGPISVKQLLSTWAVHDLNHLAQISRVMARQYKMEVGPWSTQLRILN